MNAFSTSLSPRCELRRRFVAQRRRAPRARRRRVLSLLSLAAAAACGGGGTGPSAPGEPRLQAAAGAIKPYSANPRYYERGGQPFLLLGGGPTISPGGTAEIDEVVSNGGNHIRLWHTQPWNPQPPMPWTRRTDGRFDLTQFDAGFWASMRETVEYAAARGVIVQVFAFSESQLEYRDGERWDVHPFNPAWNVNGLGLPPSPGSGTPAFFALGNAPLKAVQEAYARKLTDELGGYDNVIVELVNEYERGGNDWESHFLELFDARIEAPLSVNRLRLSTIGVPFGDGRVQQVSYHNLPADSVFAKLRRRWSSGKVQVYDEQSIGTQTPAAIRLMAWGAVLGGGHISWNGSGNPSAAREASRGVAGFLTQAGFQPWRFTPDSLAGPGLVPVMRRGTDELVAYVVGSSVQVNLTGWSGTYAVSWYDPVGRVTVAGGTVAGGALRTLTPPAPERVLRLLRQGTSPPPPPPPPPPGAPVIALSKTQLTFRTTLGAPAPPSQTFLVTNAGGGTLSWAETEVRRTGPKDWLWIKPDVGTAPTTVTVAILRDSLSTAGTFTGVDSVYATTAGVAPRLLQVTLTVDPVAPPPPPPPPPPGAPTVSPSQLVFDFTASALPQQTPWPNKGATVTLPAGTAVGAIARREVPAAPWLDTYVNAADTDGSQNIRVYVHHPATTRLAPGTYTADVVVTHPALAGEARLSVVLNVSP